MGIMHILGQIRLEIPLASTINFKYILYLSIWHRNEIRAWFASPLSKLNTIFNAIFIDGKKVAHKKNKNEFYEFQEKLWFS